MNSVIILILLGWLSLIKEIKSNNSKEERVSLIFWECAANMKLCTNILMADISTDILLVLVIIGFFFFSLLQPIDKLFHLVHEHRPTT